MRKLIALLFLSTPCWSAISLIQKVHPTTGGSCITPITATTAGDFIAVACESDTSGYATNVTDNGSGGSNTYTEILGSRGGITAVAATTSIWYTQSTHGGVTSVTCTTPSGCFGTAVYTYSGVLASGNPVDSSTGSVQQTGSGSSDLGAPTTTTNSGDVIFTFIVPLNSITAVAAPYTNFIENTTNGDASADYLPGTTLTNNQANWTDSGSGGGYGTSVAAFLPAGGAAAATVCPSMNFLGVGCQQ